MGCDGLLPEIGVRATPASVARLEGYDWFDGRPTAGLPGEEAVERPGLFN